jgi:uncharacterized protein
LSAPPYDKSAPSRSERTAAVAEPRSRAEVARYLVRHGYAVLCQDCRGRYKSERRFTKYLSEADDGYDTLPWLMRQSWCNRRIGPSASPTLRKCRLRSVFSIRRV